MIFRLGSDDWVITKDCITIKALIDLKRVSEVTALAHVILSWSSDRPIDELSTGWLRPEIASHILNTLINNYATLVNDKVIIEQIAKMVVRGIRMSDEAENHESYYYDAISYLQPCLGAFGEILVLPEEGGMVDQRADYMLFLMALRKAVLEEKGR